MENGTPLKAARLSSEPRKLNGNRLDDGTRAKEAVSQKPTVVCRRQMVKPLT
jgi:hypothetical protein